MSTLPRIRTLKEAHAEIKAADPKTAVSFNYIRKLVLSGAVSSTMAGNKYLINMQHLEDYLSNPDRAEIDRVREYEQAQNKIRPIRARGGE